jgi:ATP-dependent helicase/nuclease subunit B
LSDPKYSWLHKAIADNAQVVTASRRLARELRVAYDEQQEAAGSIAWLTPPIWSWHDWLKRQSDSIADPASMPNRLDSFSSTLLWERCLQQHLPPGVLGFAGIVRHATQSWHRLQDWLIPVAELGATARGQDESLYARAAADYSELLSAGQWVDRAGVAALVADLIENARIVVPDQLVLAGFDRLSPAVQRVAEAITKAGGRIGAVPAAKYPAQVGMVSFDRVECEMRAAGAWARAQLDANAQARIAIVSPVLESDAARITLLVREGLVPGWQYGGERFESAANVSYGRRLSDYPAVSIALLALRWTHQGLTSRELSLLLRSRCFAADETDGRSRIELALRRYPDRSWMVADFLDIFQDFDEDADAKAFLESVAELARSGKSRHEMASPAEWAKRVDAILTSVHWPGTATQDSKEFQLVNRWRELLNEFAQIEAVVPNVDLAEAVRRLVALAADALYQPESGPGLVQVLGTLEAAGMEFDSIWISGLDASQWPPLSHPAPFIPKALQEKHNMPDATPGDTLEFAKIVLQRLTRAAKHCVLSWSRTRDDSELTASSLLDGFADCPPVLAEDPGWYACKLGGAPALITHHADNAPPVACDELVRGGAYTVQRQYKEPFSAFVFGRLGVRLPEAIETGLSASTRGNIIHNALHNLLATRPGQEEIRQWTAESRARRIGSAVDSALAEHTVHADSVLRRIIGLERDRLQRMLQDFIVAESMREPFTVVDVEHQVDYSACGIQHRLRIDRIDRLADGRLLVIDYKTGRMKHFLDRHGNPVDLQLVVYADALAGDVSGLVLINVDSRAVSYKGAGAGGGWSKQDEGDWPERLNAWSAEVHRALKDLAAGDVRINLLISTRESRPLDILSRKEEQKRAN